MNARRTAEDGEPVRLVGEPGLRRFFPGGVHQEDRLAPMRILVAIRNRVQQVAPTRFRRENLVVQHPQTTRRRVEDLVRHGHHKGVSFHPHAHLARRVCPRQRCHALAQGLGEGKHGGRPKRPQRPQPQMPERQGRPARCERERGAGRCDLRVPPSFLLLEHASDLLAPPRLISRLGVDDHALEQAVEKLGSGPEPAGMGDVPDILAKSGKRLMRVAGPVPPHGDEQGMPNGLDRLRTRRRTRSGQGVRVDVRVDVQADRRPVSGIVGSGEMRDQPDRPAIEQRRQIRGIGTREMADLPARRLVDRDGVGVVGVVGLALATQLATGLGRRAVIAAADDPGGDRAEQIGDGNQFGPGLGVRDGQVDHGEPRSFALRRLVSAPVHEDARRMG